MSEDKRGWTLQFKKTESILPPSTFLFYGAPQGIEVYCFKWFSSRNILTDTPRNNVLPAIWASLRPVKLLHKINHHMVHFLGSPGIKAPCPQNRKIITAWYSKRDTWSLFLVPWPRAPKTPGISWVRGASFVIHNEPLSIIPEFILMRWPKVGALIASGLGGSQKPSQH